jgi:hypothetical protein
MSHATRTDEIIGFQIEIPTQCVYTGQWGRTRVTGRGRLIESGFIMQLGCSGYQVSVTESDHYAPGTLVAFFNHSRRG